MAMIAPPPNDVAMIICAQKGHEIQKILSKLNCVGRTQEGADTLSHTTGIIRGSDPTSLGLILRDIVSTPAFGTLSTGNINFNTIDFNIVMSHNDTLISLLGSQKRLPLTNVLNYLNSLKTEIINTNGLTEAANILRGVMTQVGTTFYELKQIMSFNNI